MHTKTIVIAITATLTAVIVGALIVWAAVAGGSSDADQPTPVPTATLNDRGDGATPVDPLGQAADGGLFDPLAIPAGITSGIGADIPDAQLTQPGAELRPGDLIIANLFQSAANANPFVLMVVDTITDPLAGEERAVAFDASGVSDDGIRVVQKVTLRIRQIAGSGDMSAWHLMKSVQPVNLKLEPMTVIDAPAEGCGTAKTSLAGHDGATNDTVQACFYAFGSVNTPESVLSSIAVTVRMDGRTQSLYVQSNAGQDIGVEDAHAHDHDEQWWEVDPVTGVPLVDPATGQVVPKAGHEGHSH